MFTALARLVIRFRWVVVVVWVVGAIAAARLLPSLSSATQSGNAQFLPSSAPSQRAAALAAPFRNSNAGATAVIVAVRNTGVLTGADDAAIARVEDAARQVPGVTLVRDQSTSADGRAHEALVVTNTPGQTNQGGNPAVVDAIRAAFNSAGSPPGLQFHLAGPLAQATDAAVSSARTGNVIRVAIILIVIILLFVVYRAILAPLVTLLPAALALLASQGIIAEAAKAGLPVSIATGTLLPVLLIGAGADYGLFLVFRMREEVRRGSNPRDALIIALGRVGQSITFSAATVIAALCCLLVASFSLYRGLGPSLAVGVAVVLLAALTLLPALLSIFGRAVFWPSHPGTGEATTGTWGRVASRVIERPLPVLVGGVVLFTVLSLGLNGFKTGGFTSAPSNGTDSAAGAAALAQHFPAASANAEIFIVRFRSPIWSQPDPLVTAGEHLSSNPVLRSLSGPLKPNGTALSGQQLASLYGRLGPPQGLPPAPAPGVSVPADEYRAYRASAQFVSQDGTTVQFYAVPAAGAPGTRAAIDAIPALRSALAEAAAHGGAAANGVLGADAVGYDIGQASTNDLPVVVAVVLAAIAVLLAVLLRSLIAPIYLIATVGLSYLAALGFSTFVFVRLGGVDGLNFVIPILLFIFAMALGEDYNILLMTRVREEAYRRALRQALVHAVGHTGGTITSAGVILAGTFIVLAIAGNSSQSRQLGVTIAFAILLDTFFVRTLLVPAIAVLLHRWNWWPSRLTATESA